MAALGSTIVFRRICLMKHSVGFSGISTWQQFGSKPFTNGSRCTDKTVCFKPKAYICTSPVSRNVLSTDVSKPDLRQSVYNVIDKYLGVTLTEKYQRRQLDEASHILLNSIYTKVDFASLQKFAKLEDSFEVWLKIVYLHVWMVLVKLSQDGRDGKIMCKRIISLMWQDIETRTGKLQEELKQNLKINQQRKDYHSLLRTSFILFDYGLLKDDATLAGSIWGQIYNFEKVDPRYVESIVHYVRFTLARLDDIPISELVLNSEKMNWSLPESFGAYF
ncbi:ubiquinol-cytochrome-c reductase complex assembly factor 1-like [Styela clava]